MNSGFPDLPYILMENFAIYLNEDTMQNISYEEVNNAFNEGIEKLGLGTSNLIIAGFFKVLNNYKRNIDKLKDCATGELK